MEDEKKIEFTEEQIQNMMRFQEKVKEADEFWETLSPKEQKRYEKEAKKLFNEMTNNGRIR